MCLKINFESFWLKGLSLNWCSICVTHFINKNLSLIKYFLWKKWGGKFRHVVVVECEGFLYTRWSFLFHSKMTFCQQFRMREIERVGQTDRQRKSCYELNFCTLGWINIWINYQLNLLLIFLNEVKLAVYLSHKVHVCWLEKGLVCVGNMLSEVV